jgi:hypothetical protein
MSADRWVVLGVAPARATWFTELARWSTAGVVPVEFVKCLSVDEVAVRLRSGRVHSAVLVDEHTPGLDRDLLAEAVARGCTPIVVGTPSDGGRRPDLGATLADGFDRTDLLAALRQHARTISRVDQVASTTPSAASGPWRGRLVGVTGVPGAGASIVAMALAQELATDPRNRGTVALADLRLDADLALLHDAREVAPGVLELVESARSGRLEPSTARRHLHGCPERGYDLLLGIRHHHEWTALPPRAVTDAVTALAQAYRLVVADVGCDLEGEDDAGSIDVADRNALARVVAERADLVVVVGRPGVRGTHRTARILSRLLAFGVPDDRLQPVMTCAPRPRRERAELAAALAALTVTSDGAEPRCATPVHVAESRPLERAVHDGVPLPAGLGRTVGRPVVAALDRLPRRSAPDLAVPVVPGSIGSWADAEPEVAG